jgi:hypothetical protein
LASSVAGTSTNTFPLQAAWQSRVQSGLTVKANISGTCTGTFNASETTPVSATFEGTSGFSTTRTTSANLIGCTPATSNQTETVYYDSNYAPKGYTVAGETYAVYATTPTLPVTVRVGDTGTIGTTNRFTSSTKATSKGTQTITYTIEADTTDTALVALTFKNYDATNTLTSTEVDRYRIASTGSLSFVSFDIVYANGVTLSFK